MQKYLRIENSVWSKDIEEEFDLIDKRRKSIERQIQEIFENVNEKISHEKLLSIITDCKKYDKKTKKLSSKFSKISKNLEQLLEKASKLMSPDVSKWRKCTGMDFYRFEF